MVHHGGKPVLAAPTQRIMKAIVYERYGPPDVVHLAEASKPVPKDDEVLVRVRAAAVTATDAIARKGAPFTIQFATGLTRPKTTILGTEFAGDVEAVGKDVTRFKPGDAVFAASGAGFAAHAEYIRVAEKGAIAIKPAGMSYEEAAAICEGALTALPFLRDVGKIAPGEHVLINGASGAVGSSAVQIAKHFGAEVTGVCSGASAAFVTSLGADHVIDYTKEDFAAGDARYDIVFDTVGSASFARSKRTLKEGGRYMTTVLGPAILLQMAWTSMIGDKKASVAFAGLRRPADRAADLGLAGAMFEAGELKATIDRRYAMEQMAEAHAYVGGGHKRGNVVMTTSNVD